MRDLYEELYRRMCKDCPNAWRCHEQCEECDEFQEELAELEKEQEGK